jgi:hypothetical protein
MSTAFLLSAFLLIAGAIGVYFIIRAYYPEVLGLSGIKSESVENQLREGTTPSCDFVERFEELP